MDEAPIFEAPHDPGPRPVIWSAKHWLIFVYVPAAVAVCLFFSLLFLKVPGMTGAIDTILGLGMGAAMFAWCKYDAAERGFSLNRYFSYAVILFGHFAFLYYLFRSRGFVDGMAALGLYILYAIAIVIEFTILGIFITLRLIILGVLPMPDRPGLGGR